jgi:hypothetical protein
MNEGPAKMRVQALELVRAIERNLDQLRGSAADHEHVMIGELEATLRELRSALGLH